MLGLAAAFAALTAAIRRSVPGRAVAAAGLAFALGLLSPTLASRRALPLDAMPRRATVVDGMVRIVDRLPDGSERLTIAHASLDGAAPLARTVRIRLREGDPASFNDGDRVRVRALLRSPSGPAYPGAWDQQRDAFYSGLGGSGFALGRAERTGGAGTPEGLAAWWLGVRDRIASRFEAGLPGPPGAIAATLMVGRSSAIAPQDRAAFTNSGLAHLLAVAGLHIGIVMGLALGAVRGGLACWPYAALRWPVRQIAAVGALAAGGLYLALTGAHLPIVRSFAMAALATLGIVIGRRAVSMRGLAVAAVLLLLVWPNEITGVSFQMSFSAVAALIAGYEALRPVFARLSTGGAGRRLALHVAGLATTSALAGTASAPFAAYHFGVVQLYFVLANMVAVPLTALWVMPLGLVSMALMPLGAAGLTMTPMGWGIAVIVAIGRWVSALPAATLAVPHMPMAGLLVLSLGIAVLCLLRTALRFAGVAMIAAGLLSPLVVTPPDLLVSGDARLIALRQGSTLMIEKRSGASKFELEAVERYWATAGEPVEFPAEGRAGPLDCDASACRYRRDGLVVLLPRHEAPPDCAGAAAVMAPFPLRDACDGLPRVDRFTVWRDGAASIRVGDSGVRIVTDRDWRGARPWMPPLPARKGRAKPVLPPAAAE